MDDNKVPPESFVELVRLYGDAEGLVVKGLLESHRIPVILRGLTVPSVHPFSGSGLGQVRVMVPPQALEEARGLLGEPE